MSTTDREIHFPKEQCLTPGMLIEFSVHQEFCPWSQEEQRWSQPHVGLSFHHLTARSRTRQKNPDLKMLLHALVNANVAHRELGQEANG